MKHPSTRDFFAYWDQQRGHAAAPDRGELDPAAIRPLLGDSFVLSYDYATRFPFRVSGTRMCALLGRDLKGESFLKLWDDASRSGIEELLTITAEETLGTVAGVTAFAGSSSPVYLELLLLPFSPRPHTPTNLTGTLAALTAPAGSGHPALGEFTLTTWRHVGHQRPTIRQRALRRWTAARGFIVYEGLRDRA